MLTIDGSFGEGGGQILRTSLSLSAITGTPVQLERIRARRPKPGLMRQHLACAEAVAAICGGSLDGAALQSQTLVLKPGPIRGGEYRFAIGSAGSALLLAQTILPVLLFADAPSTVVLEGGTHADKAPVFEFFERVFLPCLRQMGAEAKATLERVGFYPVGGGRITLSVKPARAWRPFTLHERGELQEARVTAIGSGLEAGILHDELRLFQAGLADRMLFHSDAREVDSPGPGNALFAELRYEHIHELFSACGTYGRSRDVVAREAARHLRRYLERGWVVGPFLADQLLLPLALGAGGSFLTCTPTPHTETNREVIRRFLGATIEFRATDSHLTQVEVTR